MGAPAEPKRAMLLEDDAEVSFAVSTILEHRGFEVAAVVDSGPAALEAAAQHHPEAIVVDLALSGALGLRILPLLLGAAPGSSIAVLSPFERLRQDALEAGAAELVGMGDLRPLTRWAQHLDEPATSFCECCRPTSGRATTIAFNTGTSRLSAGAPGPVWRYSDPGSGSGTSTSGKRRRKPPSS